MSKYTVTIYANGSKLTLRTRAATEAAAARNVKRRVFFGPVKSMLTAAERAEMAQRAIASVSRGW